MNKLAVFLFCSFAWALLASSIPAFADLHPQIRGNMTLAERNQIFNQMQTPSNALVSGNYFIMILKTPTGAELDNFIVNATDMDNIKHNVGIFTVCGSIQNSQCQPPVFTNAQPTTTYCPIAVLIHFNEDGYDNFKVGNSTIFQATTPPAYCNTVSVPEFLMSVLPIAIALSILVGVVTIRRIKN